MLEIKDIKVELDAEAGIVKAIDGMRLTLARGETFALLGSPARHNRVILNLASRIGDHLDGTKCQVLQPPLISNRDLPCAIGSESFTGACASSHFW